MTTGTDPAILGGDPAFEGAVPIARPHAIDVDAVLDELRGPLASGMITSGEKVRAFEEAARERLATSHAVALGSCTSGLLLSLKALGVEGEVVMPSFTFSATGHAAMWNGLPIRFVDVEEDTLLPSPEMVQEAVSPDTGAILLVHCFGNPCHPRAMEEIAEDAGVPLIFDAAHALGASHQGRPIGGFGDVEVFSLSPTKLVVAAEGGLATTDRDDLADLLRMGRNYANPGDYDTRYAGLSARMSELHAVLARLSLGQVDAAVDHRNGLADLLRKELDDVPGLSFQRITEGSRSTYKDLTFILDDAFGMHRDVLAAALAAENVHSRPYFHPALHQQTSIRDYGYADDGLAVTEDVVDRVLSIPDHSHVTLDDARVLAERIRAIQARADEVVAAAQS